MLVPWSYCIVIMLWPFGDSTWQWGRGQKRLAEQEAEARRLDAQKDRQKNHLQLVFLIHSHSKTVQQWCNLGFPRFCGIVWVAFSTIFGENAFIPSVHLQIPPTLRFSARSSWNPPRLDKKWCKDGRRGETVGMKDVQSLKPGIQINFYDFIELFLFSIRSNFFKGRRSWLNMQSLSMCNLASLQLEQKTKKRTHPEATGVRFGRLQVVSAFIRLHLSKKTCSARSQSWTFLWSKIESRWMARPPALRWIMGCDFIVSSEKYTLSFSRAAQRYPALSLTTHSLPTPTVRHCLQHDAMHIFS